MWILLPMRTLLELNNRVQIAPLPAVECRLFVPSSPTCIVMRLDARLTLRVLGGVRGTRKTASDLGFCTAFWY